MLATVQTSTQLGPAMSPGLALSDQHVTHKKGYTNGRNGRHSALGSRYAESET